MNNDGVPTLRAAIARVKAAGGTVEPVTRTGEVLIIWGGTRIRHNNRRKDASRALIGLLRKIDG
jgi:hypothetical protein